MSYDTAGVCLPDHGDVEYFARLQNLRVEELVPTDYGRCLAHFDGRGLIQVAKWNHVAKRYDVDAGDARGQPTAL